MLLENRESGESRGVGKRGVVMRFHYYIMKCVGKIVAPGKPSNTYFYIICNGILCRYLFLYVGNQFRIVTLNVEQNFELQAKYSKHDHKYNFLKNLEICPAVRI